MTRNLRNWNYREVTSFLKENGFGYGYPLKGSHQAWVKLDESGEPIHIVEVSRPQTSYKIKTLAAMVEQSGIPQEEWFKWSQS